MRKVSVYRYRLHLIKSTVIDENIMQQTITIIISSSSLFVLIKFSCVTINYYGILVLKYFELCIMSIVVYTEFDSKCTFLMEYSVHQKLQRNVHLNIHVPVYHKMISSCAK